MKIHCKYNDKELIGEDNVISLNSQSQTLSIFIGINGDYTCNDFYVYGGDDWLTYNRMGNEIKIKVKSNYNHNRDTSLYFTHAWNKNVMCIYVYKYRLSKKRKMRITKLLEEEYSFFLIEV